MVLKTTTYERLIKERDQARADLAKVYEEWLWEMEGMGPSTAQDRVTGQSRHRVIDPA